MKRPKGWPAKFPDDWEPIGVAVPRRGGPRRLEAEQRFDLALRGRGVRLLNAPLRGSLASRFSFPHSTDGMDAFAQHYFELRLLTHFLTMRGDEFQVFFSRVMSKAHPGDFEPTRPWGNLGDRKCDGYLRKTRTLYQCYAPAEMSLEEAKRKIDEDFDGALPHQKDYWDNWTFVHNAQDGRIATDISMALAKRRTQHKEIKIEICGWEEIRRLVLSLPVSELVSLLGPYPTAASFEKIGFSDLAPLLAALDAHMEAPDSEVRPTPPRKIEHNKLGPAASGFLKMGMAYAPRVRDYLASHPDKTYGDRITKRFNDEYGRLKGQPPDHIYAQLFTFVNGPVASADQRTASCYAILAYMFEECEIFERPPPAVSVLAGTAS